MLHQRGVPRAGGVGSIAWLAALAGGFLLPVAGGTAVLDLTPRTSPLYPVVWRFVPWTALLVAGSALVLLGLLLVRQSYKVRDLTRIARDPRGLGAVFIGSGSAMAGWGIVELVIGKPSSGQAYAELGSLVILPAVCLMIHKVVMRLSRGSP